MVIFSDISKKTLIFHPNSEIAIIEYCKQAGFDIFVIKRGRLTTIVIGHAMGIREQLSK